MTTVYIGSAKPWPRPTTNGPVLITGVPDNVTVDQVECIGGGGHDDEADQPIIVEKEKC